MNEYSRNTDLVLEVLPRRFSVCRLKDHAGISADAQFLFFAKTDEEFSLVCPEDSVPDAVEIRDDGWRTFRIRGILDFSLIGILAGISSVLADAGVGIFAVTTYNTDYILVKEENLTKAAVALESAGYRVVKNLI